MKLFGGFHGNRSSSGKKPLPEETEEKTQIKTEKPAPKEEKLPEAKTDEGPKEPPKEAPIPAPQPPEEAKTPYSVRISLHHVFLRPLRLPKSLMFPFIAVNTDAFSTAM